MPDRKDVHWLQGPSTIRRLWRSFIVVLALSVLAELVIERHPLFGTDGVFAFNAWFGLGSCVAMVLLAKLLGAILKRPDTYYDR